MDPQVHRGPSRGLIFWLCFLTPEGCLRLIFLGWNQATPPLVGSNCKFRVQQLRFVKEESEAGCTVVYCTHILDGLQGAEDFWASRFQNASFRIMECPEFSEWWIDDKFAPSRHQSPGPLGITSGWATHLLHLSAGCPAQLELLRDESWTAAVLARMREDRLRRFGGFHGHGGTPRPLDGFCQGKSHLEMDDSWVPLFPETSIGRVLLCFWRGTMQAWLSLPGMPPVPHLSISRTFFPLRIQVRASPYFVKPWPEHIVSSGWTYWIELNSTVVGNHFLGWRLHPGDWRSSLLDHSGTTDLAWFWDPKQPSHPESFHDSWEIYR